jgi:Protein of unknown function (DUF2587)
MTEHPRPDQPNDAAGEEQEPRVVVIGPNGMAVSGGQRPAAEGEEEGGEQEPHPTDLVEQPAKVMRIGGMIRQLLEEVKSAPLDPAARTRLADVFETSIAELKSGLAPELVEELERLTLPFSSETPSEAELRIAQAQLVGWLEGLFHGIQTAIYAQQMAARAQLEQMRRALPPGIAPAMGQQPGQPGPAEGPEHRSGGMYL